MTGCNTIIARGTTIKVAPSHSCSRVLPPETVITVDTGGAAAAATTIPITVSPAIPANNSILSPFWVKFVDSAGNETLVEATANLDNGDTALLCVALERALPAGATAAFPPIMGSRESAELTSDDVQVDINTFENDGWKDSKTTQLGNRFVANGFYSPLDPGWRTIEYARQNFEGVYLEIQFPNPEPLLYVSGQIVKGHYGVNGVPIAATSVTEIIRSNVEFMSRGEPTYTYPA